ncbi:Molybdopterin synthase catalytic subunit [Hibiscus syriacus]|uniref:Molybdopterin synthase catalytic subunit n=1 Tax=Hibiscus syriacus TaxID=106335 RepID=A0A6A2YIL3_HIBSY|nr:Molybdopterin synthase catalytic subunit [Hibiscus syriacus]
MPDTFEGKTVVELRYVAYVPMAIRNLKPICYSARSSWDLNACKFLINELKASVPISKKEIYSNGEVWKENAEFLEQRSELLGKDGDSCRRKVETEAHDKKGCCKARVKVEEVADTSN